MSSIEKANAVFSFVFTVHGPHSNLDAQNLRDALWDLDPSDIRWVNYLTKFTHYFTMLSSMPQLDAEGKPSADQFQRQSISNSPRQQDYQELTR